MLVRMFVGVWFYQQTMVLHGTTAALVRCPPLSQGLALVVPRRLQVSLQALFLGLQLLGVVGLQALAGADVLQLLQQLLLLVDEDEAISLGVQQPRPRLAVQFGDLHLDGGDPEEEMLTGVYSVCKAHLTPITHISTGNATR